MAFFQKVRFVFLNLQISKKKFQKTILSSKFKFQVQDSFLEYIFLEIWRFEKHIALSEKKPPLGASCFFGVFFGFQSKRRLCGAPLESSWRSLWDWKPFQTCSSFNQRFVKNSKPKWNPLCGRERWMKGEGRMCQNYISLVL